MSVENPAEFAPLESAALPVESLPVVLSSSMSKWAAWVVAVLLVVGYLTELFQYYINLNWGSSTYSLPLNIPIAALLAWMGTVAATIRLQGNRLTVSNWGWPTCFRREPSNTTASACFRKRAGATATVWVAAAPTPCCTGCPIHPKVRTG